MGAMFWHDRMAVSWSDEDSMAIIHANYDQEIRGLILCDRMALVQADHDQTVQKDFRIWFEPNIRVNHYFDDSKAYIAPIDESFIA